MNGTHPMISFNGGQLGSTALKSMHSNLHEIENMSVGDNTKDDPKRDSYGGSLRTDAGEITVISS